MRSDSGRTCRICGDDALDLLQACRPFSHRFPHGFPGGLPEHACGWLYRCRNCGIVLREPCLNLEEREQLYREMPEAGMKEYVFESNASWVEARRQIPQRASVLDIGSNLGVFLAGLSETIEKYGVEPSVRGGESCARQDIQIIAAFVDEIPTRWHERFDFVCMFDVFEHLPNPMLAMESALSCLRPGGSLFISTGNFDHWAWRWTRRQHWYLDTPQHLTLGSRRFFEWFSRQAQTKCRVQKIQKIPHLTQHKSRRDDLAAVLHWGCMLRGGVWRILQRLIQISPRWSGLMHQQGPPYAPLVADHLLVALIKE